MMQNYNYCNPILCETLGTVRDPQILRLDDMYYMTGTVPPYWEGDNPGVKLWSSRDLLNWKDEGFLIRREEIPADAWYRDRFWAPEIHAAAGGFFLTFNCRNDSTGFLHSCGIARSSRITGPYEILSHDAPLVSPANDAHLFTDEDGRHYMAFAAHQEVDGVEDVGVLMLQEIALPEGNLLGEPWVCTTRGASGEWDSIGVEGSFIVKRHGLYFHFYSSWTRGYEVGLLVADNIRGPWRKSAANPILTPRGEVRALGHNSVFPGPDGRDWLAFHVHDRDDIERLSIDPIEFHPDGTVSTNAPSAGLQTIRFHTL